MQLILQDGEGSSAVALKSDEPSGQNACGESDPAFAVPLSSFRHQSEDWAAAECSPRCRATIPKVR